jgi:steroid 5-alpha reductase family enzyme
VSLWKNDVSIVDSVWSLFFLIGLFVYWFSGSANGPRAVLALILVGLWASRLCLYITYRNHGRPEDRRYQAIRERNQPRFELKSLFIIFIFQALLAWFISMPILPVLKSGQDLSALDILGSIIFVFGLAFETLADWQMHSFRSNPDSKGKVMDQGLWKFSRHPNYFGEFSLWWGFFIIAVGAGAPLWIILSPLLISYLLLKISGVPLLEQDLLDRRPGYREYQARTNSFFPGPLRK